MMKTSFLSLAIALGAASQLGAQSAPTPEAAPNSEPEIVIRRAIPVGEPMDIKPDWLPRTLPADVKMMYSQCSVESNVIAITFDDGPDPHNTPRLLDMLKERGIKATFFLVGKCAATWPDIVKRMLDEGHEIGNHTWNHYQLTRLGESRVVSELQTTQDAIQKACGIVPTLYRPPYGATRASQQKFIHDHFNYTGILWDVDPLDWKAPRSAAKVHSRVVSQTKPGSIILCHDIHKETVDAMPATLDDLKARGFQFVTVPQLINLESQTAAERAAILAAAARAQTPATAPVPQTASDEAPRPETTAKAAPPAAASPPPSVPVSAVSH